MNETFERLLRKLLALLSLLAEARSLGTCKIILNSTNLIKSLISSVHFSEAITYSDGRILVLIRIKSIPFKTLSVLRCIGQELRPDFF